MQQTSASLFSLMEKNVIIAQIYSALQPGLHSTVIYAVS